MNKIYYFLLIVLFFCSCKLNIQKRQHFRGWTISNVSKTSVNNGKPNIKHSKVLVSSSNAPQKFEISSINELIKNNSDIYALKSNDNLIDANSCNRTIDNYVFGADIRNHFDLNFKSRSGKLVSNRSKLIRPDHSYGDGRLFYSSLFLFVGGVIANVFNFYFLSYVLFFVAIWILIASLKNDDIDKDKWNKFFKGLWKFILYLFYILLICLLALISLLALI